MQRSTPTVLPPQTGGWGQTGLKALQPCVSANAAATSMDNREKGMAGKWLGHGTPGLLMKDVGMGNGDFNWKETN